MATKKGNMGRKRGNVATGKRISKLENWEISKFVGRSLVGVWWQKGGGKAIEK